jgi:hypothetical protein
MVSLFRRSLHITAQTVLYSAPKLMFVGRNTNLTCWFNLVWMLGVGSQSDSFGFFRSSCCGSAHPSSSAPPSQPGLRAHNGDSDQVGQTTLRANFNGGPVSSGR